MADAPSNAITAAFPAPPPFYKSFTFQNLARLQELRNAGTSEEDLPSELRKLVPPPPPTAPYRSFGELHEVSQQTAAVLLYRVLLTLLTTAHSLFLAYHRASHLRRSDFPSQDPHSSSPASFPFSRDRPIHRSSGLCSDMGYSTRHLCRDPYVVECL